MLNCALYSYINTYKTKSNTIKCDVPIYTSKRRTYYVNSLLKYQDTYFRPKTFI